MKTTMNYTEQAMTFLVMTNTKMKVRYLRHDKYFDDDEESRDIYRVTFSREGINTGIKTKFSITFGQSIANQGVEPSAYDVLSCLTKDDPESFENFCANFGYSTDLRMAYNIYRAVKKEWEKVSGFWTAEELEQLREIQ